MLFCSELGQSGNSESIAILALANRIQTQLAESIRNPNPRSANKRKSQAHVQDVRHAGTRLSEKSSGTRIQQEHIHQSDTNRRSPRCTYPDDSWLGTLTRTATRQNRSHCLWSEACVQCWYASRIYTYTYSRSVQTKDNYNATIPATILACAPL